MRVSALTPTPAPPATFDPRMPQNAEKMLLSADNVREQLLYCFSHLGPISSCLKLPAVAWEAEKRLHPCRLSRLNQGPSYWNGFS